LWSLSYRIRGLGFAERACLLCGSLEASVGFLNLEEGDEVIIGVGMLLLFAILGYLILTY
jgi:hypothetical protein